MFANLGYEQRFIHAMAAMVIGKHTRSEKSIAPQSVGQNHSMQFAIGRFDHLAVAVLLQSHGHHTNIVPRKHKQKAEWLIARAIRVHCV